VSYGEDIFCDVCPKVTNCHGEMNENLVIASLYSLDSEYSPPQFKTIYSEYHKRSALAIAAKAKQASDTGYTSNLEISAGSIHRLDLYFQASIKNQKILYLSQARTMPSIIQNISKMEKNECAITFLAKTQYDKVMATLYQVTPGKKYSLH